MEWVQQMLPILFDQSSLGEHISLLMINYSFDYFTPNDHTRQVGNRALGLDYFNP
jgi:hypothetical protein